MNYSAVYEKLINSRRDRIYVEGYTEKHHILPRKLGGPDDISNLIILTAREHYVTHLLLAKIHGGPMWHALFMMTNFKRYNGRMYEWIKKGFSKRQSESKKGKIPYVMTEDIRENMKRARRDRDPEISKKAGQKLRGTHPNVSPEGKETRSKAIIESNKRRTGCKLSQEHKDKISESGKGLKRPPFTDEHRRRLSENKKAYFEKKRQRSSGVTEIMC